MSALYSRNLSIEIRIESVKKLLLILLLCLTMNAHAAVKVLGDEEPLFWFNGANYWSMQANGSLVTDIDWVWPANAGSGGQALLTDGTNMLSWGVPSTSASHVIFSATHTDTVSNDVTRGSLMYGNSTPKWDELVIGAANTFLKSDGTDAAWGFIDISDSTNLAVTTPITLTGDSIGIVNQGTTTTVLHGNAGGNASFGVVDISDDTNLAVDTDHFKLDDDTIDMSDNQDTNLHSQQGSFLEQIDFTVTEAAGTVTGSLEKEGTGDLTMYFSDEFTVLDCTAPLCTVDLTGLVGTDSVPAEAFVYVPQSTKTLTAAGSWPAASVEHIRVTLWYSEVRRPPVPMVL